jgi:uncharacterized protein
MTIADIDIQSVAVIALALFLGGIVKGALGMGTPVVAVPVIAAFLDIRTAVIIMVVPNLATNLWQQWQYRDRHLPGCFALKFALGGGLGAIAGTTMLASLATRILSLALVAAIFCYIAIRLYRPAFRLEFAKASRIVTPMGVAGGILQGMAGISAPVAVSFLNAMRLDRPIFIATISSFFISMSMVQLFTMIAFQLMTRSLFVIGFVALLPLALSIPIGSWLGNRMSARTFDLILLVLLTVLSLRMLYGTFMEAIPSANEQGL